MNAAAFRVWILRFLRIRFRWFFVGSDWLVFVGSEFALVFQDRDLVGFLLDRIRLVFLDLDIRFFVGSDLVFLV